MHFLWFPLLCHPLKELLSKNSAQQHIRQQKCRQQVHDLHLDNYIGAIIHEKDDIWNTLFMNSALSAITYQNRQQHVPSQSGEHGKKEEREEMTERFNLLTTSYDGCCVTN